MSIALVIMGLVGFLIAAVSMLSLFRELRGLPEASGKPGPRVSIIVPARNEEGNLSKLLGSLEKQSLKPMEVIVVDDQSDDGTAEVSRSHGATVLAGRPLPEGWFGKPWACQQGADAAQGDVLLFLDADLEFEADGLSRLAAAAESKPGTVLSVCPWHRTERPYEQLSVFFNLLMVGGIGAFTWKKGHVEGIGLFGQTLWVSKALYQNVGGHHKVRRTVLENFHLSREFAQMGVGRECFVGRGCISMRDVSQWSWRVDVELVERVQFRGGAYSSSGIASFLLVAHRVDESDGEHVPVALGEFGVGNRVTRVISDHGVPAGRVVPTSGSIQRVERVAVSGFPDVLSGVVRDFSHPQVAGWNSKVEGGGMWLELPGLWVFLLNALGVPLVHIGVSWCFTKMPASWFRISRFPFSPWMGESPELHERVFRVKSWKRLLPDAAPWFGGFAKKNLRAADPVFLEEFRVETCRSEAAHWAQAVLISGFVVWTPSPWAWLMPVYALLSNLPCILLQRQNRLRLNQLLARSRSRAGGSGQICASDQ